MSTTVKKGFRRVAAMLAAVLLLTGLCVTSLAAETETGDTESAATAAPVIDWTRTGSLTIQPKYNGNVVTGCTFSLFKVADYHTTSLNPTFVLTSDFAGAQVDGKPLNLNASATSAEALEKAAASLASLTSGKSPSAALAADKDTIPGLDVGVYLVLQNSAPGNYTAASPFLVFLPRTSDDGTTWEFDITATPKLGYHSSHDDDTTSVTVTKVWNDAGSTDKRPASVTVGLYQGSSETPTKTVELSDANSWKYTWTRLDKTVDWKVDEVSVPDGYESFVDGSNGNFTITNTRSATPLSGTVTATKVWNDNKDAAGKRPASVSVTLSHDGKPYETVVLNAGNDWTKIWIGLPETGTWTVAEDKVPAGYTAKVSVSGSVFTVTNSYGKTPAGSGGGTDENIPDENVPKGSAPYTGMLQWPIPILLSVGVLLVLAGVLGGRKKKYAEA